MAICGNSYTLYRANQLLLTIIYNLKFTPTLRAIPRKLLIFNIRMKKLSFLVMLISLLAPAKAFHIVGGEIFYDCLGGTTYEITLKVYRDCYSGGAEFDDPLSLGIFTSDGDLYQELFLPFPGSVLIDPDLTNPCMVDPPDVCVEEAIYTTIVDLPASPGGYDIVYQRCCRNTTIVNLVMPENQGATYTTHIPDPGIGLCNSSPRFNNFPPVVICAGFPFNFDHSASDPDGDSLAYSLCAPFLGGSFSVPVPSPPLPPPYINLNYSGAFSAEYPIDADPPLSININTGWMEATPNDVGQYVVGVCVEEWRDGELIGTHYRDFQFNITDCTPALFADFPEEYNNCDDLTIYFENNSFGTDTWYWDFGIPATEDDTSSVFAPVVTYPDTGTYTVMLVANPFTLCADTAYSEVQIYPNLIANYAWETDCALQPVNFGDVSTSDFGYLEQWQWDFGDGSTSTETNPEHVFEDAGFYSVELTVLNTVGCTKSITHEIEVYSLPLVDFDWDNACIDQLGLFTESATIDSAFTIEDWYWSYPDGSTETGTMGTFYFDTAGAYPITLVATSDKGCIDSFTQYISVRPYVIADVTPDTIICEGDSIQLFVRNGVYYQWFPNYNITNVLGFEPVVYPEITTTYTVIVSDECTSDTAQITVEVLPAPEVEAWGDTAVYRFEPVPLFASGGVSYSWNPADNMDFPDSPNPILYPSETDGYVVTVTGENGCTANDTVSVVVWLRCQRFTIPTAFSPNGDGLNDVFRIASYGDDDVSLYQIYNRWGEIVFETNTIVDVWDGTFKGKEQETGVYMYLITVECEDYTETFSGTITLLN